MNIYEVGKCDRCHEPILVSESGTIKVSCADDLEVVMKRIKRGESLKSIAKDYCSYCLWPIRTHASKEEYTKHPKWLPYHEPQPQDASGYV